FELNPLSLQRLGLPQAIRELIRTVPAESKLKITFEENISRDRLNPDLEMAIYRILQEALSNIIKYAEASQVDLRLNLKKDHLYFSIRDDGKGFDPGIHWERESATGGFGLTNMEERVTQLGGTFHLETAIDQGVTIRITFPRKITHA
ncbi:MAG: hypothetical protein D6762_04965, partial [Candidatus Neomarinimicrobiota bacterium]